MLNQHARRFFRVAILAGGLLMIACGASPVFAVPPCDDSPDPCFTNVTDILNGRRQLLPTDDLVVTGTFKVDSESFQDTDIWTLPTTNSAVSGQTQFSPYSTVTGSPADAFKADSRIGRMFNLPNDVVVTVAPTGRVGNLQLLVKIKDTSNTVTIPDSIVAFSQNAVLHSITLGDITGDGFDDLFVSFAEGSFGGVTVAASAVDVDDPSKGLFWNFATRDDCPYAAMVLVGLGR